MEHQELLTFLQSVGKDPTRLIFEDELTGISNRRFLGNFFTYKVDWETLSEKPVSLIMVDLDFFKNINDTHGHDVGDQALIHVAEILKEVSGDTGLPIRYAGDEFMILLPETGKGPALAMAEKLVETVRSRPCLPEGMEQSIPMTFSVGVASAPDDAKTSKELVHKADNALYHSKKNGRDQKTDAAILAPPSPVKPTVLAEKARNTISGRKEQLAQLVSYLKRFMQRESQVVLIHGAPGMGKTTFLSTIEKTLSRTKLARVRIAGRPEELFRPYYLAGSLVLALMDLQKDKGVGLISGLSPEQRESLAMVIPQLGDGEPVAPEDGAQARERIFATLVYLLGALNAKAPLVLLVDDLHLADEASLLLLRTFFRKGEMPLFVCGTAAETSRMPDGEPSALDRFRENYSGEIPIHEVRLSPLSPGDVGTHVSQLFPGIELPEATLNELAQVSQGNPLFLNEILQKLARDGKLREADGKFAMEQLPEGYLPQSIEEIVSQKMTSLGEEGKKILDTVSAYGEEISLGTLSGTTQQMEARLLEFLDQAVNQGLVSVDFDINDESIRFIGSRVRDIVYSGVRDPGREIIHERIGAYQETLLKQGYLPSASILAYHFQRSANLEKAKVYEQLLGAHNAEIFNAQEAAGYTGEWPDDLDMAAPLDQEAMSRVPLFLRNLLVALRNTKLYPGGSQLTANAVAKLKETIDGIHQNNERLVVGLEKKKLFINTEEVDISEFKSSAETFIGFLENLELCGITFEKGVAEDEISRMLTAIGLVDRKQVRKGFWKSFSAENQLSRIRFRQVRYKEVAGSPLQAGRGAFAQADQAGDDSEREFGPEDLAAATDVIKSFLGAASKMKLYPPDGPVAAVAIGNVLETLSGFFALRPHFTMAVAGNAFLLNGMRAETEELSKFTPPCSRYLQSLGLKSLTFRNTTNNQEFVDFFTATANIPRDGVNADFWRGLAREKGIAGILFDQTVYGVMDAQKATGAAGEEAPAENGDDEAAAEAAAQLAQAGDEEAELSFEDQVKAMPPAELGRKARELFVKGDGDGADIYLNELLSRYPEANDPQKREVLDELGALATTPELIVSESFLQKISEKALPLFSAEEDPGRCETLSGMLFDTGMELLRLGSYPSATWVLGEMNRRREEVEASGPANKDELTAAMDHEIPADALQLLTADAVSQDPEKQRHAVTLLASLGADATTAFVSIIRGTEELRARQLAASHIARGGSRAVQAFKDGFLEDANAFERARMLEVLDTVTRDVGDELSLSLADENPKVRSAAFALAERVNTTDARKLVLEHARHKNSDVAESAIRSIGRMREPLAVPVLSELLRTGKSQAVLTSACRAIGQIRDNAGVPVLEGLLKPKGFWFFKKWKPTEVRLAATLALRAISSPQALAALALAEKDPEARVRDTAKKAMASSKEPPPA